MSFSTNELRARAAAFVADHAGDADEMRHTQTFWNDFFDIFGVKRARVAVYERAVDKISGAKGRIDLFWPGVLIVEQKSLGRDLLGAEQQAIGYLHKIPDAEWPKYVLTCDFRRFRLLELESGARHDFLLQDLPKHIEKFRFILGQRLRVFKDQDPVNIRASELVGHLHDLLKASGYTGHKLEVFLTRIVFCLFADDTEIFQSRDSLMHFLEDRTAPDGSDLGPKLTQLFDVLNTPPAARQSTLSPEFTPFEYVNGGLFRDYFPAPAFDSAMRTALLNACRFDWAPISPAIFGSLFQSVMDGEERRKKGAHYTSEQNILKLIGPLFLDDLRAEFDRLRQLKSGRTARLMAFHDKLARLTFFDPACGCGNFLIIAYRELRLLETDLLLELRRDSQLSLDVSALSRIDVDQFYGIEIEEFPARIAETAMWMMDHLMNRHLSESADFGGAFSRIPLKKAPVIVHGDALAVDWAAILPPEKCSYLFGNPPFVGAKYQSEAQRAQVRAWANLGKSGGTLDYVAAWFLKAGAYLRSAGAKGQGPFPRIAFVATNSITQGEQVGQLWPLLFDRYRLEISFAHRTFEWMSDARGKAHVHVVILGLDAAEAARPERRLFSYEDIKGPPGESRHSALSPYLFDASGLKDPHTVVKEEPRPINGLARIIIGSKPIDGGHYIFSGEEMRAHLAVEPEAAKFFHPYIGSREFLHGGERFILNVADAAPNELRDLRLIRAQIEKVRAYRLGEIPARHKDDDQKRAPGISSRQLAETPRAYHVTVVPETAFLALPKVSSERRVYVPFGWLKPPTIPSDLLQVVVGATIPDFALLTSAMHMAWLRHIGGRLKSDFRYSIGLVYNTFPLPEGWAGGKVSAALEPLAQGVLNARAAHPGATLADLYDPDLMPADLRRAHQALDRAVDRLYRPAGFASDRERVEHLFARYEAMAAPLLAPGRKGKRQAKAPKKAARPA